jgi:type III restriction enzyme
MTDAVLRMVTQRLSLRPPQAASLEILADVLERVKIGKDAETAAALAGVRAAYPQVEEFERAFPSLCFALATGVGKTRLMGAFIAYLFLTQRSRHFFVLAPNTTIYDKLILDFSPESPKYVFRGIAEFAANPPDIITGDNYETGRGVRLDTGRNADLFGADVHINIFNIDKINKEESPRGKPRMRRLQETIGESYYGYLSKLDDLVLLMDEAHRYRASAGAAAINELCPILGLELTATPKTVGARSQDFKNVIYRYDLGEAMQDGFIKDPAVATRANFDPNSVSADRLERIKLEDGVHHHDHVSVELDRYHRVSGRPKVHPFMLVVAQDTTHARALKQLVESEDFFQGRFKDKVIEVHSAQTGQESEDAMARLVALEIDARTEIVIHVNKLKEGWDVTNLYTIVPLRASASEILTEQTLGRGLRLPYGMRVARGNFEEFAAVDRLTVIAHDRFDEVIQKAKEPGSILQMKALVIGEGGDISATGTTLVEARSLAEIILTGAQPSIPGLEETKQADFAFQTPQDLQAANVTLQVVQRYERRLGSVEALRDQEVQKQIEQEVTEMTAPLQGALEGVAAVKPDIAKVVKAVTETVAERTISIPKIVVLPKKQVTFHFADFDLEALETINSRPISDELLVENLRTGTRIFLARIATGQTEMRVEDYLVRYLIERNEIDYDTHAELLYKLSGQVVGRVRSYLSTDREVENVLLSYGRQLADFVFAQMMQHYRETALGADDYEVRVTHGFTMLRPQPFSVPTGQAARSFKQAVMPLSDTRRHVFGGFAKCCYPLQRFESDPERRFAVIVDRDANVQKWMKPSKGQFQIDYRSGQAYEPDFVVEARSGTFICEVKSEVEMKDPVVQAKANAARKWCKAAAAHAAKNGGKPWSYALIPDGQIMTNATLDGLMAKFVVASQIDI